MLTNKACGLGCTEQRTSIASPVSTGRVICSLTAMDPPEKYYLPLVDQQVVTEAEQPEPEPSGS